MCAQKQAAGAQKAVRKNNYLIIGIAAHAQKVILRTLIIEIVDPSFARAKN
jgi:hypothetical protein